MRPAPVTDSLLHDLVMSSLAEGTETQFAVAAAVILDDRILLCGHDTGDFDREWDLPGGMPLPGETLTECTRPHPGLRLRAGRDPIRTYLGSTTRARRRGHPHLRVHRHLRRPCADLPARPHRPLLGRPRDLPEQTSQDLARLTDIAMHTAEPPRQPARPMAGHRRAPRLVKGIYCDQAATELLIRHRTWLRRDDFTTRFIITQARPGTSPQPSAGKRPSPPCRQEPFPAQAAKPPSSTWPPASPAQHLLTCGT